MHCMDYFTDLLEPSYKVKVIPVFIGIEEYWFSRRIRWMSIQFAIVEPVGEAGMGNNYSMGNEFY